MKTKLFGKMLIYIGLLLIAAGLSLTTFNVREQVLAKKASEAALLEIEAVKAAEDSSDTSEQSAAARDSDAENDTPDYQRDPNTEMPEFEFDGENYIGTVSIPALKLQLPVISEWSYPRLKKAPCRFQGSAYLNNMIIMAHNYAGTSALWTVSSRATRHILRTWRTMFSAMSWQSLSCWTARP